jgi:maltose alpha-D-glucosyltransferase/alpha-amylase
MTASQHRTDDAKGRREIPVIHVARLRDTLTVDGLKSFSGELLLEYLNGQRWFGAKGQRVDSVRVIDVVPLPWDDQALAVAIVELELDLEKTRYQIPMALRRADPDKLATFNPGVVIAAVQAADGEASLIDAIYDPVFQQGIAGAFAGWEPFALPKSAHWSIQPTAKIPLDFGPNPTVTVGSADQSNTALVIGRQAFLKLFRKIEPGVHPDVELTRFLTVDAGFANVPTLLGTVAYNGDRGQAVAAMLQEYLAGSRDAWAYVVESAKSGAATANVMLDIERLGVITRELHDALGGKLASAAGPDIAPVAAGAGDVELWAQRVKTMIRKATTLLDQYRASGNLESDRAAEAEALVGRRDDYVAWVEELTDGIGDDAGMKIRIHGDYHLGQVLRTSSDSFVIIDFEGEPARHLAERREKASALRDVAGMLRSLSYAAATIVNLTGKPGDGVASKGDARAERLSLAERELIAGRWERDARSAFLRGYTGSMKDESNLLPRDPRNFDKLLSLLETEKVFYELAYELDHRPGWEWIPMRGISRLLVRK